MKKPIYHFSFILGLFFIQCDATIVDPPGSDIKREATQLEKQLAVSSNEFGFNLFHQLQDSESGKNIFISPLSVSMALGMTLNGAVGTTFDAMQQTLQLNNMSQEQINQTYKSLIDLLSRLDSKVVFSLANSIWYRQGFRVESHFINENKTYFDAEIHELDFSDPSALFVINNWVKDNTEGKIEQIIERISRDDIMFLINAIYFKGTWTYEFDKNKTVDDLFFKPDNSTVPVKMMIQDGEFDYFANQDFQAINLPYGDGDFSMTIFLPRPETNIDNILDQVNESNWQAWQSAFVTAEGTVHLPRFKLEQSFSLNDILKEMGMEIAFSGRADFSRINSGGGLFISEVLHKTFIEVNEEGTEAAAVTAVIITRSAGGRFVMKINRPFLFFIHENRSQTILFMGKVLNPLGENQ